jgi:polyhydroxybutyrate depolymerase
MRRPRRRVALPLAAAVVALASVGVALRLVDASPSTATRAVTAPAAVPSASTAAAPATASARASATPATAPATTSHSVVVLGQARTWVQIDPGGTTPAGTILVVLHGRWVTPQIEIARDGLLPLVAQTGVTLVYPAGIGASWNAGDCCGVAAQTGVDDLQFLHQLVAAVDPGHVRPIDLVGYSNGGRLAYAVACQAPALVDGFAVVNALPDTGCTVTAPITLLQLAGTADPEIAYRPGDNGVTSPAVTTEIAALTQLDACITATTAQSGSRTLATWDGCTAGNRVALATYTGGDHSWPVGDATTPGAARTILDFFARPGMRGITRAR